MQRHLSGPLGADSPVPADGPWQRSAVPSARSRRRGTAQRCRPRLSVRIVSAAAIWGAVEEAGANRQVARNPRCASADERLMLMLCSVCAAARRRTATRWFPSPTEFRPTRGGAKTPVVARDSPLRRPYLSVPAPFLTGSPSPAGCHGRASYEYGERRGQRQRSATSPRGGAKATQGIPSRRIAIREARNLRCKMSARQGPAKRFGAREVCRHGWRGQVQSNANLHGGQAVS